MSPEPPPRALPPSRSAPRPSASQQATSNLASPHPPPGSFSLIEAGPSGAWRIALAGVVGACVLGAGLGFVARPAPEATTGPEPEASRPVETIAEPLLQVVVDETPAPVGLPIEVLPPDMAAAAAENAAPYTMPRPPDHPAPDAGRVVRAVAVAAPAAARASQTPPRTTAARRPGDDGGPSTSRPATKTAPASAPALRAEARSRAAPDKPKPAAARAGPGPKPQRTAKAEARAPKPAPPSPVGSERRKAVAVAKSRPTAPARKPAIAPPEPPRQAPLRGEGATRVARAGGCGTGCDDALVAARERQLQRAYAEAEAAGVPPQALRRQQARWQQARAAAAREAPWAVEDVYLARISELRDLTRDARDE